MKLAIIFSLFFAATATAEEAGLRKRELAGGSISGSAPCFSKDASVQVFGKGAVTMEHLQVGDRVFTGDSYETVYSFAHLDKTREDEFIQIQTDAGNSLEATSGHFVFVDGKAAPVRVDSVQVGDALEGAIVTKIGSVQKMGVYAPLTMDGKIVVDGVKASNYVSLHQIDADSIIGRNLHTFSHVGIAPFRLLCTRVSTAACESYNEEDGIPHALVSMHQFFDWFMNLPSFFQALMLVAYLAVASVTWMVELALNPALVPALVIAGVGLVATGRAFGVSVQTNKAKTV